MKFHYKHQQGDPRCTIAIEDQSLSTLDGMINNSINELKLFVGVTFVHPEEAYVKKLGRENAEKNIVQTYAFLEKIKIINGKTIYDMYCFVPDPRPGVNFQAQLNFGLSRKPNSPYVFLEYAYVQ
jgi:hypothetical protein